MIETEKDFLVVMSKVRDRLRKAEGMNTSAGVYSELTKLVDAVLEIAVRSAKNDKRKTVMARDITFTIGRQL